MALMVTPMRGPAMPPEQFLREMGAADGRALGAEMLANAVQAQDASDMEMSSIVIATFGGTAALLEPLLEAAQADWHTCHEDVVDILGEIRCEAAVDVLRLATEWVPDYLADDEGRSLARKAIRALGTISGQRARRALEKVSLSPVDILREHALYELGWTAIRGKDILDE